MHTDPLASDTIRIQHFRRVQGFPGVGLVPNHVFKLETSGFRPDPKGGATIVTVRTDDGRIGVGRADCSKKDNFSRPKGRLIATERAYADLAGIMDERIAKRERTDFEGHGTAFDMPAPA